MSASASQIPVLDTGIVRSTAVRDEDILTEVIDYGTPRRDPAVRLQRSVTLT